MAGIYDILMGAQPDAAQSAQALAAAIRGERAMGAMGGMAGGGMPGLGKVNDAQALQDQNQLEKATEARMRYGAEEQNRKTMLAQTLAQTRALTDIARAQMALQGSQYASDSNFQKALLKNDLDTKQGVRDDAAWQRYVDKTNPGLATSRSVLGQDKNVMQRVDRTLTLINAKPYLTPEEMADVNVALAGVLTGGNTAARKTIDEISYKTLNMKLAEATQFVANRPTDARAQAFVKRIASTLEAEREAAKSRVRETVTDHAIGMQELLRRKGKTAIDYHRQFGVGDDILGAIGLDVKGTPSSPGMAAHTSMSPEDAQAKAWLQQNPNHPSAAAVAAKLRAKGL